MSSYREAHRRSLQDVDNFWGEAAQGITWDAFPTQVVSEHPPSHRWFADGRLNTCFNAVDRHVEAGHGDRAAVIYDSPVGGTSRVLTYYELLDEVSRFAGVLSSQGVERGDRVVIYMPMVPEAVVAMLATARLGAIHSVVFGGFAAHELALRIDDARPKVIVSASCGIEPSRVVEYKPLLDAAINLSLHKPSSVVVLQRAQVRAEMRPGRDLDWHEVIAEAEPKPCVSVNAHDPLYILYTSGTTGRPRGVVRDNGGHAVALAWSMGHVYGVKPGETWWAASDIGWVVGHSYIVYAPLLIGATTVLYEGKPVGTPDAGAFWRVIAEHGVVGLFTAPTAIRAIKRDDPQGEHLRHHDLSSLRTLFVAGERLDPDTYAWAGEHLGVPVVDNWWQTETGWPICANPRGFSDDLPLKAGSPSVPMPGYDVHVVDEDGHDVASGVDGAIVIRLPLPPGNLPTLWEDDERFVRDYLAHFPGNYLTGDGGHLDADGYLFVMGRIDDVINVAGHRLSTGAMEEVLSGHPDVAECAVIGVADQLKGQIPRGLVVLKSGVTREPRLVAAELVQRIRDEIGPLASLRQVDVVAALPKTRSGKILRRTMRAIADGEEGKPPSTIEDPGVLDALRAVLDNRTE
ncbi:MAG: propionyl-CoA synthetase [Actinomycetes bacterium]